MNNSNTCCDRKKKRLQEKTPNCYHQKRGKEKAKKMLQKQKTITKCETNIENYLMKKNI